MAGEVTAALTLALLLTAAFPALAGAPGKWFSKDLPANPFCPWDAAKLGACFAVLGGAAGVLGGSSLGSKCCQLVGGLGAAEAAACLCATVKETVLGVTTEWSVGVGLLASSCKKDLPDGFKCV